jgi:tetratricopeptide (TPR) repeat protein
LFGRGRAVERVLRLYDGAARLVGLPAGGRARRSARSGWELVAEPLIDTDPMQGTALAAQERQLGADRLEGLASHADPTYTYRQGGWLTQAIAVHERALADRQRQFGPDHPHTQAARANLAYAYHQAGWLTRAIPLYERTLTDRRRLLGPNHPRTLRSANYLASAYRDAGRLAEAIPLLERTLARCTQVLGSNHALTRKVRRSLYSAHDLKARRTGRIGSSGQREQVRDQRGTERADSRR